tara:strand:- start:4707 stop:5099 length:393 start_codon:yes stop_codon:yes gene_type:complete
VKKIFTLHIFLVIIVFGCIGTKKKKDLSKEKETKTLAVNKTNSAYKNTLNKDIKMLGYTIGRVINKTKTSGCTFIIQVNDSSVFEPVNLESKFKKDSLKIAFKHKKSRAMTTCMMGQTVVLSEVKALKEE